MWTCRKALILTISDAMINCNCFNVREHSLLVLNEVSDSYLTLWIDYYLSIRNHMKIFRMIMMLSCPYFILSTPLSLNMWTYFSISASAWGQARSKLGGVYTSILHHVFLLLFMMFLSLIMLFGVILMPFLS